VERSAVRLDVTGAGHFDFRNHFVEIGTLLRPSPTLDLGATTPHFIYNLGLSQWLLALPALLALRPRSRPAARVTAFFVCLSVALVLLISPVSRFAWEAVPAAAFIQFPWRFLGPAALALAMCAGYSVTTLQSASIAIRGRPVRPVAVLALMGVLTFALPTMYPPLWDPDFGDSSPRGILDFELSGVALGTTSTGDFVPTSVSRIPPPNLTLIDTIRDGRVADRFDSAGAPGTRVKPDHLNDLAAAYSVEAPAGFTARFYVFAFPGWQAFVDGQPVTSHPSQGDGFMQFEVPASARSFGIRFESTPPRTIGSVASLASALVAAALFVTPILRKAPTPGGQPANYPTTQLSNYSTHPLTNPLFLSLVIFLILKVAVLDRCDTCFRYTSPPGQALAASTVQSANFGNHIALLGFDPPRLEVEAGQILPLTLYWKATAPVPINYQVFAHLTRPLFILWGQSDKLNPGDFPSTRWPLDKYVWDDHRLRVLPGTPPGEYAIDVGLYTLGDGRRAPVFDASGAVVGDSVQLDLPVHVVRPAQPPSIDSLGLQTRLDVRRGGVTLLGASIEQVRLAHPNFARFTLFWQASIDAPGNFTLRARLIDTAGKTANEIITAPAGGAYPTSAWQAGEIVRDVYAFWLPPDFPAGVYDIRVNLEGEEEPTQPAIDVGQLEVTDK
jgi:hypothetical protein